MTGRIRLCGIVAVVAVLVGCGGGDAPPVPPGPGPLAAMTDSFGNRLAEGEFAQGDPRAAGIDGTAAEGKPLPQALVRVADASGKTATTHTDDAGYFRLRVDGMSAPLVVTVQRPGDGEWRAVAWAVPPARVFATVNVSPLTHQLLADLAQAAGVPSPAQVTPAVAAAHRQHWAGLVESLRAFLRPLLLDAGLDPATFDPVGMPFRANGNGLDAVLDRLLVTQDGPGGSTLRRKFPIGGIVRGLAGDGLVLASGTETVRVGAGGGDFRFGVLLAEGSSYHIGIAQQPSASSCAVTGGEGVVDAAAVTSVRVDCGLPAFPVGGTVEGLATAGLRVALGSQQVVAIPAGATTFSFPGPVASGTTVSATITAQPAGSTCSIAGSGVMPGPASGSALRIRCEANAHALSGRVEGLASDGLVLAAAGQQVAVGAWDRSFAFGAPVAWGSPYTVEVARQPVGHSCSVLEGSGVMPDGPVGTVVVQCEPRSFPLTIQFNPVGLTVGLINIELTVAGQAVHFPFQAPGSQVQWPVALPFGTAYEVRVTHQPAASGFGHATIAPTMLCAGGRDHAGIAFGPLPVAEVRCESLFLFNVRVSGLTAPGLVLSLARGDVLAVAPTAADPQTTYFGTPYPYGGAYAATIRQQPASQTCTIANPEGTFLPLAIGFNVFGPPFLQVDCRPGP